MGTLIDILGPQGAELWRRIEALVALGPDAPPSAERDALALELVAWQRDRCPAIDRVVRAFAGDEPIATLSSVPGVPTDAFKSARIACFDERYTARTFLTSGTTREVRGQHELFDTSLYRTAALATAARYLLPAPPYRFVLLAEPEEEAPTSSLGFMLARFVETFGDGSPEPWMVRSGRLDAPRAREALSRAAREGARVALLGASFGFVHLLDALGADERFAAAPGSVALATGGFKGRSREVAPEELFAAIGDRFGLARTQIVQEYGMTELSSQAYEDHRGLPIGRYAAPPWLIASAVDPVTLGPVPPGEVGLLRLVDLVNVGSCAVIQTSDLGRVHSDGSFEVHGRAPGATPRGCARALDALLS